MDFFKILQTVLSKNHKLFIFQEIVKFIYLYVDSGFAQFFDKMLVSLSHSKRNRSFALRSFFTKIIKVFENALISESLQ